jgi:LmbE family N-acetylglucosaminyl deacetylase
LLEVVQRIEAVIDEVHPDAVYTQHGGDLNIDHVTLYRATLTATRPVPGHPVRAVYAYEVASSTEWSFARFAPAFRPTTFVDISSTLEVKLTAIEMYEAEVRSFPHPRSREALRAQALHRGSTVGVEAAEAFELVRKLR